MLKDITLGQYLSGHSFLHKMDPRGKIIAVMLYMVALFVINNAVGYWSMAVSYTHLPQGQDQNCWR